MPYMIVKRNEKYHVHKQGTDSRPEGKSLGSHDTREEAEVHRNTISAAVGHDVNAAKYAAVDFKPTDAMAANAIRGLTMAESARGVSKKVRRVGALIAARQPLSPRSIKQMDRFFARIEKNGRCVGWGDVAKPAIKWISYLMYGGDGGIVWTRGCRDHMSRIDADGKTKMDKTLNISDAGSLGNAVDENVEENVEQNIEEKTEMPILSYIPAKYGLDEVVVVKSLNAAGVITGVERQKSGAVMYSLSLTGDGGLAVCATNDLERVSSTTKSAIKKQIYQLQLKMLATRARFLLAQLSYDRPVKATDYFKLLKTFNQIARNKELPFVKRPRFSNARKKLQAAYVLSKRNPYDSHLFSLMSDVVGGLTKLSKSRAIMATEKDVIKSFNKLQNGNSGVAPQQATAPTVPLDEDVVQPAPQKSAIKSLQAIAQKCVNTFGDTVAEEDLGDALDEMYQVAESATEADATFVTRYKGTVEAVYSEVSTDDAKDWAQKILDSIPDNEN